MKTTEKPMAQAASANELKDAILMMKDIEVLIDIRVALNESLETSDDDITSEVKNIMRGMKIFGNIVDELPVIFARAVHTISKLHKVSLEAACNVLFTRHDGLDYIGQIGEVVALILTYNNDSEFAQAE